MRMNWSIEANGGISLRCPKNGPYAVVQRRFQDWGFIATILELGLPNSGPYRSRDEAAHWAERIVKLRLFPAAEFGPVPQFYREKIDRDAAPLFTVSM